MDMLDHALVLHVDLVLHQAQDTAFAVEDAADDGGHSGPLQRRGGVGVIQALVPLELLSRQAAFSGSGMVPM